MREERRSDGKVVQAVAVEVPHGQGVAKVRADLLANELAHVLEEATVEQDDLKRSKVKGQNWSMIISSQT